MQTNLLIVGAGPFGVSAAARCLMRGVDHELVGMPFSFWREHMPEGMLLRSPYEWHLCPEGELSFERYLQNRRLERTEPIPLERFLDYGSWFVRERGLQVRETLVTRLGSREGGEGFVAETEDGEEMEARHVLCAPGLGYFRNIPERLAAEVAPGHWVHSADISGLDAFAGQRCLIVGGRQSAFELAALLAEHGAQSVSVVLRHSVPDFVESDWSWVPDDLRAAEASPGWFARQPEERRQAIGRRFWEEGRLRLEPWLAPRLRRQGVEVIPESEIESTAELAGGGYRARLRGAGACELEFDRLILATGFAVNLARVPYLKDLLPRIELNEGSPRLTAQFESRSLPGLYLSGFAAARDFGPYMGFLASCPFAARTAVDAIASRAENAQSPC